MKKKLLCLFLSALSVAVIAAGCGGSTQQPASSQSSVAPETSSEPESTAAPESSAAPAEDEALVALPEKFVLGLDASFPPMALPIQGMRLSVLILIWQKLFARN